MGLLRGRHHVLAEPLGAEGDSPVGLLLVLDLGRPDGEHAVPGADDGTSAQTEIIGVAREEVRIDMNRAMAAQ